MLVAVNNRPGAMRVIRCQFFIGWNIARDLHPIDRLFRIGSQRKPIAQKKAGGNSRQLKSCPG